MSLNLNMSMAVVADVILMQDGLLYGIFHQVYIYQTCNEAFRQMEFKKRSSSHVTVPS